MQIVLIVGEEFRMQVWNKGEASLFGTSWKGRIFWYFPNHRMVGGLAEVFCLLTPLTAYCFTISSGQNIETKNVLHFVSKPALKTSLLWYYLLTITYLTG